ncbi:hypothetical protein GCM10009549_04920 [Streptomyces thermoalcalitolerans]|uniref:Uncharacterized protein n=1 Tax=Streptomyces thermoalcalitolerans TaxID=65605 RepID=A0ABN1ND94_9ACTN
MSVRPSVRPSAARGLGRCPGYAGGLTGRRRPSGTRDRPPGGTDRKGRKNRKGRKDRKEPPARKVTVPPAPGPPRPGPGR